MASNNIKPKNTTRKKSTINLDEYLTLANPFQDGKGNRCYMNAAIQLLYSIPELKALFSVPLPKLDSISYAEKDCKDTHNRNKNTLEALAALFKTMSKHTGNNPIDTQKIIVGTSTVYDILLESAGIIKDDQGYEQSELGEGKVADADSFLSKILEVFTCLQGVPVIKNVYASLQYNDIDTYKCKDTNEWNYGMEVMSTKLSLPVSETTTSIQKALTEYMNEESLIKNPLKVEACGDKESIAKKHQIKLTDTTKSILITLTRNSFNKKTGAQEKIERAVNPTVKIQIDNNTFELQGVIRHTGGTGNGHYTYQVYKNGVAVVNLNDAIKIPTNRLELLSVTNDIKTEGYIFLYRRVSNSKSNSKSNGKSNATPDNKLYMPIWKECKSTFEALVRKPTDIFETKNLATKVGLLTDYKKYMVQLYTRRNPTITSQVAFFDKLEAIREFYARSLILLCCMDEITDLSLPINDILLKYSMSPNAKLGPYEIPFLLTPLMFLMASWEWSVYYSTSIFTSLDTSKINVMPLHLKNLISNETDSDKFLNYPKSLLIDYAMFYPFKLSLSGN